MLASISSQHLESDSRAFGNPPPDSTKTHPALGSVLNQGWKSAADVIQALPLI
jgi:hypothetical protein